MHGSAVQGAGISPRYVKRQSEKLEPRNIVLELSGTQRYAAWCGKELSELKHFGVENVRDWALRYKEKCSRFPVQRDGRVWFPLLGW